MGSDHEQAIRRAACVRDRESVDVGMGFVAVRILGRRTWCQRSPACALMRVSAEWLAFDKPTTGNCEAIRPSAGTESGQGSSRCADAASELTASASLMAAAAATRVAASRSITVLLA